MTMVRNKHFSHKFLEGNPRFWTMTNEQLQYFHLNLNKFNFMIHNSL